MNIKRLLSAVLIAVFALAVMPLLNPEMKVNAATGSQFINDARWKHGVSWGSEQRPKLSSYDSKGCCAYAADFVKYCYGSDNLRSGTKFTNASEIRSGDVIYITGYDGRTGAWFEHWFVVISRSGNTLHTAEGNFYPSIVNVSSSKYSVSGSTLKDAANTITFQYGYHYSGGSNPNVPPTIASVSTAKTLYAVDEKVTFNISADGDTTHLWIYCPNGQTLTYKNVGATYTVGFGMSGYYEGLVETWNGKGSKKSSRISWRVGKPTICNLSIAKDKYAVDEKVTFNMKVDGTKTNLWIYCPNGQTLTYKDVGATYTVGFGMSGHYEALAETWNGIGSKQSERVSWDVGSVTPTDTQPPTIKNAKVVTQNKDTVVIEADITDNVGVSFVAHSVWNAYGQYANDGIILVYGDYFNQEWISSTKVRFTLKYKPLTESNFLRIQATDATGNNSFAKVPFTTEAKNNLYMKVGETKKVSEVWSSLNSIDKYLDKSYYNDVITYSNNTFTAKKPGRATLVYTYTSSGVTSVYAVEVVVSCATHSWDSGKITKSATCTTSGVKTYTCSVCKETKAETVNASGHNHGVWTKLNDTQHQRVCANNTSHIEKANHTWDAGKVTTAATTSATGVKTYTCTVCEGTKTESIPKLPDNSGKPSATTEQAVNEVKVNKSIPKIAAAKIKTIGSTSKKQMTIEIPKVAGATNYIVAYKTTDAKTWKYYYTGSSNKYVIKSLKLNSTIQFRVAAYKNNARGDWSNISYRYMMSAKSSKAKAGKKSITVTWKKDAKATGYQVLYSTNKNMKSYKTITLKGTSKTKRVIKGLKKGKPYYVRVRPIKKYKGKTYVGILSAVKTVKAK